MKVHETMFLFDEKTDQWADLLTFVSISFSKVQVLKTRTPLKEVM